MLNKKATITGHFISHWGVPSDIRPIKTRGIEEFALLEFGPRGSRKTWRYATNGMSSYVQSYPDRNIDVKTEIYACSVDKALWIEELLVAIASYPIDYDTSIAQGDTIDVGSPIDRQNSPYTGILFAPPNLLDGPTLGVVGGLGFDVLVHQIVGILPVELQYAEEHGGMSFLHQFAKLGELPVDCKRLSVLRSTP